MKNRRKYIPALLLILSFALIAIFSYKDYGLTSDEHLQRDLGKYAYEYVFEGNPTYTWYGDKDYGVAIELPLYIVVDVLLGKEDLQDVFQTRHLILHLLFLVAVFVFFSMIKHLFKSHWLALLGALMLLLHPRIYAHSFFNSKDLPLLSFTIFGLYFLWRFIDNRKFICLVFLAIFSALIINNRIVGVMFYALVLGSFILEFILKKEERKLWLKHVVLFVVISVLTLYITWPILWKSPLHELGVIFKNMAHFRWEDNVLFRGEIINATNLPWSYIPYWFMVTTPVVILALGFLGCFILVAQLVKTKFKRLNEAQTRFVGLNLLLFVMPVISVIVLNSVLYDGWRHVYFIYPSFLVLGLYVLSKIQRKKVRFAAIIAGFMFLLFDSGVFMVKNHPNQQVYFNGFLRGKKNLNEHMEMDYWGQSYKGALEYILEKDTSKTIILACETGVCKKNADLLSLRQKQRLKFTAWPDSADYFVTNYRWYMLKDSSFSKTLHHKPFYDLKINNTSIMTAWKLKP